MYLPVTSCVLCLSDSVTAVLLCFRARFSAGEVTAMGNLDRVRSAFLTVPVQTKTHAFVPGDTVDKLTATLVKAITSAVVMVACGSRHTCVKFRGTNRIVCFGLNDFGQSSQAISAASSVPITELRFIDNPGKEAFSSTIGASSPHQPSTLFCFAGGPLSYVCLLFGPLHL